MLDILGVWGKSKKNRNSSNQQAQQQDDSPTTDEGYVIVNGHQQRSPYPQAIILNDELIRMGSSSSVVASSSGTTSSNAVAVGPSSSVYPSLDPTVPNTMFPFSSAPSSGHSSLNVPSMSGHHRTASPIDNVPFSLSSVGSSGPNLDEDYQIGDTLNRVQLFLSNASQSEYNFNLENSILRESMLSS